MSNSPIRTCVGRHSQMLCSVQTAALKLAARYNGCVTRGTSSHKFIGSPPPSNLPIGNFDAALLELQGTRRGTSRCAGADALEGEVWLRKRAIENARKAFHASIERDGPTPVALTGLATVAFSAGNCENAAMHALDALATDIYYSRAHYCLAAALLQLEKPNEAIRALEAWAAVAPSAGAPYRWMARAYEQQLHDSARASDCRKRGREIVRRRRSLNSREADDTSTLLSRP